MNDDQSTLVVEQLARIIELLENLQPKKKPKQVKIPDTRTLEDQILPFRGQYAPSMIQDFLLYFNEGDRWKKEKVWDLNLRLKRWKRMDEKRQHEKEARMQLKQVDEQPSRYSKKEVIEDIYGPDGTGTRVNTGFNSLNNLFSKYGGSP